MDAWKFYTSKELKPEGWLYRQLRIQADGLSGNLDKMWRDVRDSAWIGGPADGWERVPYWLDGFVPLAYLLNDADMIQRAKRYIDGILERQRPDGWICPGREEDIPSFDTWALQLMSKVLTVYYDCSSDERIPDALYRMMKNYYDRLASGQIRLFGWGKFRWFEAFVALRFLDERYGEDWIRDLGRILKEQGADYPSFEPRWHTPLNVWTLETHIVNLGMMLKAEALCRPLLGPDSRMDATVLQRSLEAFNGTPVGLFTGDECLAGLSPIQGSELCSVAEQMYSYEWLMAVTGDPVWAERLELLAFNALPGTISDDMWTHQYLQMSNQISCTKFPNKAVYRANGGESGLFGLEPNYGCCTANFNQAWPKFALSAFLHDGTGRKILSAVPVPSGLHTDKADVTLQTDYPFRTSLVYTVRAKEDISLEVRVPSFVKRLSVDGKRVVKQESLTFAIPAGTERTIRIDYGIEPEFVNRPYDLKSVRYGSLVFSLPIPYQTRKLEYERDGVERKFPYCDYELIRDGDWAFAFSSMQLNVHEAPVDRIPFSSEHPPVRIEVGMRPIPWGMEDGYDTVCAKTPQSRMPIGPEAGMELVPYGCAKLRMTEIPLI